MLGALGPLEDRGPQTVPRVTLRTAPVPAHAVEPAVIALVTAAGLADARQQCAERAGLGERIDTGTELCGDARELGNVLGRHGRRQQPGELPRRDATVLSQPPAELSEHVGTVH